MLVFNYDKIILVQIKRNYCGIGGYILKILFYRYGSICEEDILECMKISGHEVIEVSDEITNKNITFKESVEIVDHRLQEKPCDCVFTINFFPALSDLCNIYNIRYICWIVDSPVMELFAKSVSNQCNRIFVFDREQYNDIYKYNPKCIFHYPLAVNVEGKQSTIQSARLDGSIERFKSDISFVGSLYTEKSPYDKLSNPSPYLSGFMAGAMEAQLKVYGYYFIPSILQENIIEEFKNSMPDYYHYELDNYFTDKIIISQLYMGNKITSMERTKVIDTISKYRNVDVYTASDLSEFNNVTNKGTCKTITEMPLVFNNSRINLNPTSKAIRSGVPLRVFDIMACEGFVLSNYQTEMCELFTPGVDFVYYDSIESIPEVINYYLEHENERKEIAHNGFEKVKDEYNYLLRLNKLLLIAFEN